MTKSQERAIESVKRLVEKHMNDCFNNGEIKEWKINENEYFVSLWIEIGDKDDEGTWGQIIGRDSAHLYIGKKGGITYPVSRKMKNGEYKYYQKRFKGYSILQAIVDQR